MHKGQQATGTMLRHGRDRTTRGSGQGPRVWRGSMDPWYISVILLPSIGKEEQEYFPGNRDRLYPSLRKCCGTSCFCTMWCFVCWVLEAAAALLG